MTRISAGLAVAVAMFVVFSAGDAHAQRRGSRRGAKAPGKVVFRGGVNLDAGRTINLGGKNEGTTPIIASITPGIGYYFAENASLDFDIDGSMQIAPTTAFNSLGVTPGVRYEISQFYARAGAPVVLLKTREVGVLGGVGYLIPMGEKTSSVIGADYTYWLTPAYRRNSPYGKVELKLGVQQSF